MDFSSSESWLDLIVIAIAIIAFITGLISIFKLLNAPLEAKNEPVSKDPPEKWTKTTPGSTQPKTVTTPSTRPPSSTKPVIEKIKEKQEPPKTVAEKFSSPIVNKPLSTKPTPPPEKKKDEPPTPRAKKADSSKEKKIFELPVTAHVVEPTVPKRKSFLGRITQRKSSAKTTVHQSLQTSGARSTKNPELIPEKLTLRSANSMSLSLRNNGGKLIYRKITLGKNNELDVQYQPSSAKIKTIMEEYPNGSSITFYLDGKHVISRTYQFNVHFLDMDGNEYSQKISGLGKEYPIVEQPVRHMAKK